MVWVMKVGPTTQVNTDRSFMTTIREFFEDDLEGPPSILFAECIGEHTITDVIRQAIIYASSVEFSGPIDLAEFTEEDKALAVSILFYGPFDDIEEAIEDSILRSGVIVAPSHLWAPDAEDFVYIAVLAN